MKNRPLFQCAAWLVPVLPLFLSAPAKLAAQNSEQDVFEDDIKQAVVMLECTIAGSDRFGAGIIMGADRDSLYIATANHLVRQGSNLARNVLVRLRWYPGKPVAGVVLPQANTGLDLAVVRVDGVASTGFTPDGMPFEQVSDPANLHRRDDLYLLGYPLRKAWRINTTPEKLAESNETSLEFESNLLARGHSGGALLNKDRQIVGMLRSEDPPYAEAVSIVSITGQFRKWGLPVSLGSPAGDLRFSAISSGRHTCALTKSGVPYCWGSAGTYREAGEQEDYEAERQAFERAMRSSKPGENPGEEYIKKSVPARGVMVFSTNPRRVRTLLRFVSVSAGILHTCAMTSDGAAYCWGSNEHGELGNGSKDDSLVPVPVAGGLKFRSVMAGNSFTCGITAAYAAYCWGSGYTIDNQGDNQKLFVGHHEYLDVLEPHAILTKVKLRSISIDRLPDGQAFGTESLVSTDGALLIAPGCCASPPGGVPPHTQFVSVDGGCGLTSAEKILCFTYGLKTSPAAGSLFRSVSAFDDGACAVTKEGAVYCWGVGENGELGPASKDTKAEPLPISGSLAFQAVSRGDRHTCGLTREGEAYCWGTLPNHAIRRESWFRYGPTPVRVTAR